jgi:ribosomal protein S15P/S13E
MSINPRFVVLIQDTIERWSEMTENNKREFYINIRRTILDDEIDYHHIVELDIDSWGMDDQLDYLKQLVSMYADQSKDYESQISQLKTDFAKYKKQVQLEKETQIKALQTVVENSEKDRQARRALIHASEILRKIVKYCGAENVSKIEQFLPPASAKKLLSVAQFAQQDRNLFAHATETEMTWKELCDLIAAHHPLVSQFPEIVELFEYIKNKLKVNRLKPFQKKK